MNIDFTTIIDYIGTFAFAISGIRLASTGSVRTWLELQLPLGEEQLGI